ncbi:hypothetical protein [Torque teno equus virus 1]|uniref:Uncharacterized protein n=1 Tax=Torque teno equus virus 1 TaxID=1673633 RepID=A0A0H4AKY0_9VIRU|nr:hypothetical protein [Torque teno equus virus 1]AKN50614.1 hypothetical protein [Torque teno equus virus 1]
MSYDIVSSMDGGSSQSSAMVVLAQNGPHLTCCLGSVYSAFCTSAFGCVGLSPVSHMPLVSSAVMTLATQ